MPDQVITPGTRMMNGQLMSWEPDPKIQEAMEYLGLSRDEAARMNGYTDAQIAHFDDPESGVGRWTPSTYKPANFGKTLGEFVALGALGGLGGGYLGAALGGGAGGSAAAGGGATAAGTGAGIGSGVAAAATPTLAATTGLSAATAAGLPGGIGLSGGLLTGGALAGGAAGATAAGTASGIGGGGAAAAPAASTTGLAGSTAGVGGAGIGGTPSVSALGITGQGGAMSTAAPGVGIVGGTGGGGVSTMGILKDVFGRGAGTGKGSGYADYVRMGLDAAGGYGQGKAAERAQQNANAAADDADNLRRYQIERENAAANFSAPGKRLTQAQIADVVAGLQPMTIGPDGKIVGGLSPSLFTQTTRDTAQALSKQALDAALSGNPSGVNQTLPTKTARAVAGVSDQIFGGLGTLGGVLDAADTRRQQQSQTTALKDLADAISGRRTTPGAAPGAPASTAPAADPYSTARDYNYGQGDFGGQVSGRTVDFRPGQDESDPMDLINMPANRDLLGRSTRFRG